MKTDEENKSANPQDLTFSTGGGDVQIRFAKQTGSLMFKFDDDEPTEGAKIYDYAKVKIELQQEEPSSNIVSQTTSSIEFKSKSGKKFTLYIENIPQ